MKPIVKLHDNHNIRGYEILTNLIFSQDQWSKIGKYYKYMVNELRNQTNKIIILDITVSIKFQYPIINLSSENMAKIIPKDKNSIFKISLYGIPNDCNQDRKLELHDRFNNSDPNIHWRMESCR